MIKKFFSSSEFLKNVLTVMTGTTLAQLIPIIFSPVLTRQYSSEDFGVFTLYFSTASIFSLLATLRYEMAILLPKEENDSANLFGLSLFISLIVSILSLIFVLLLKHQLAIWFNEPMIEEYFL